MITKYVFECEGVTLYLTEKEAINFLLSCRYTRKEAKEELKHLRTIEVDQYDVARRF